MSVQPEQVELSPPQIPHSSNSKEPPGTPRQSHIPVSGWSAPSQTKQVSRYPLSQRNRMNLKNELMTLAQQFSITKNITTFFIHPNFPVDNRHNIKVDRLKLAHHFQYRLKEAL